MSEDIHIDVRKLTEAFIRFSVRLDGQVGTILTDIGRLTARFDTLEAERRKDREVIDSNRYCLEGMKDLPGKVETLHENVDEMQPWVDGLKWALRIGGAVVVVAVVGAIVWAVGQSGAGLP